MDNTHGNCAVETSRWARSPADGGPQSALELKFLALFGAYFLLHFLLRCSSPYGLEMDEGAELVRSQSLRLSYGAQPPLYSWLVFPLMQFSGPAVWPLALVKNLLLFGTHVYVYGTARALKLEPVTAFAASASLLLIPQFGWESQRDLTHSVLVTHVAAGTLWIVVDMIRAVRPWHAPMLGLAVGLGLLSKHNYLLFLAPLAFATMTLPSIRQRLAGRSLWRQTGAITALVIVPYLVLTSDAFGWPVTVEPELLASPGGFVDVSSLPALAFGIFEFLVVWAVVCGAWFVMARPPRRGPALGPDVGRTLVCRYVVLAIVLLAAGVVAFGVEDVKDRWLQPILFPVPLAVSALFAIERVRGCHRRVGGLLIGVTACLMLAGRAVDLHGSAYFSEPTRLGVPLKRLVEGAALPAGTTVIAVDPHVAGAFVLHGDRLTVHVQRYSSAPAAGPCTLVWLDDESVSVPTVEDFVSEASPSVVTVPGRGWAGPHRLGTLGGSCVEATDAG